MTEDQIKHMVSRFLAWKLPENFSPDGGVKFERTYRGVDGVEYKCEPSGTNLFDFNQAEAMVRHMLDGLPRADAYDRGRRDVLNAILAPNPPIAAKLAGWAEPPKEPDPEGRMPFDVALWVTEVAAQLGIKSVEEMAGKDA